MAEYKAYCVKCKQKNVEITNPKPTKMKTGRWAVTGTHAKCGTKLFRIAGNEKPEV